MREMTRVDAIYETLRDRICLGQYNRGDIFHEANLGQEFKVSRTPIRQVLQRLAFEKLAVVRTGVGTVVEGCSDTLVPGYLEMHARMLSAAAELGLTATPEDYEELVTSLQVRASRLSADAGDERFWALLKALNELCDRLLGDDLLRHMNELLFYRSGPALMRGIRAKPAEAARMLKKSAAGMVKSLEKQNHQAFFEMQCENIRQYRRLLAV